MTLNDNPGGEIEGKITRGEEAYDLLAAAYKGGVNVIRALPRGSCSPLRIRS